MGALFPQFFGSGPPVLTDPACKNAQCPVDKTRVRLVDAGGLYLEVTPNGAKRWFWKYRFGGKEKRLALGNCSEAGTKVVVVSLKDARDASAEARRVLKTGTDPVQRRKADTAAKVVFAATTFKAVALEYHAIKAKSGGWSATHAAQWLRGGAAEQAARQHLPRRRGDRAFQGESRRPRLPDADQRGAEAGHSVRDDRGRCAAYHPRRVAAHLSAAPRRTQNQRRATPSDRLATRRRSWAGRSLSR